jgi:hypothetical protein
LDLRLCITLYHQKGGEVLIRHVKSIGSRRAGHLAASAAACAVLAGSGFLAAPAMAAPSHAGAIARPAAAQTTGNQHVCENIGSDDEGNQAIVCTNLIGADNSSGYYAYAQTLAYCQDDDGDLEQCANITVANETGWGAGGPFEGPGAACGHANGACPATKFVVDADDTPSGSCIANVWGVTDGDGTTSETSIQLPGTDITETLKTNFGTPHTNIGDC